MTDRPILFSAPMVQALLAGRKTQTRRIIKLQTGDTFDEHACVAAIQEWRPVFDKVAGRVVGRESVVVHCPYGQPGDGLYVRETWKPHSLYAHLKPREIPVTNVFYRSDDTYAPSNTPWVPAIHMPRWASRISLKVTDVRVERLQDISEWDARSEGLQARGYPDWPEYRGAGELPWRFEFPRDAYRDLWEHINGPGSWAENPLVWAVSFEVIK